jgi:hypothetical protein
VLVFAVDFISTITQILFVKDYAGQVDWEEYEQGEKL